MRRDAAAGWMEISFIDVEPTKYQRSDVVHTFVSALMRYSLACGRVLSLSSHLGSANGQYGSGSGLEQG